MGIVELTKLDHSALMAEVMQRLGESHDLVWFLNCKEEQELVAMIKLYEAIGASNSVTLFSDEFVRLHVDALKKALA